MRHYRFVLLDWFNSDAEPEYFMMRVEAGDPREAEIKALGFATDMFGNHNDYTVQQIGQACELLSPYDMLAQDIIDKRGEELQPWLESWMYEVGNGDTFRSLRQYIAVGLEEMQHG